MSKYSLIFLYSILIVLYVYGMILYSESKFLYTIFTVIYFSLLFSALYRPISYSYVFLSIFLFLGMWLKLTLHLIFDYSYVEPIGSFYTSNANMDDVLIIATIGVFGVISSNIIYRLIKLKSTIYIYENYIFEKPAIYNFYETYRLPIYIIILITTLTLVYLNIAYQIQLSGIVSKTILLYPLNAIVYWILGTGFSVLLLVLFSLDIKFKNILKMKYLVFFAFIVAITSVGLLSRGQYVFMLGSVIVFLLFNYKNLNNLSISKLVIYILFVALLYLFVIHYVTLLRGYYFSGASLSGALNKVLHLAVDRWIGLEGLMAV